MGPGAGPSGSAMAPAEVDVLVVGAGVAGLAVASSLGVDARTLIVDRLPMFGGVLGYEHSQVRLLATRCRDQGVDFELATTAARWDGQRVMLVGPNGIRWVAARQLVVATGTRPSSQAELGIAGERMAGVLPAPVAIHLAEAEAVLGLRVVVIGSGNWAERSIHAVRPQRVHIIGLSLPGDDPSTGVDEAWSGWTPRRIDGSTRVAQLTVSRSGADDIIACDAIILAARSRPLRNVDGAIWPDSEHVTFIQPVGGRLTADQVIHEAREAGAAIMAKEGGAHR
jgi:hypothetical protein